MDELHNNTNTTHSNRFVVRFEPDRTPPIVERVLMDMNWVDFDDLYNSNNNNNEDDNNKNTKTSASAPLANLWWKTSRFFPSDMVLYNEAYPHARLNHFPRSGSITKKDNLHRNLRRFRVAQGGGAMLDFAPTTFVLPGEYVKFCQAYGDAQEADGGTNAVWICKPSELSRGRKIFVFRDIGELLYDCSSVVQRYVHNPLLIDGRKFDLRIYVLVTSFQPLRVYMYDDCLARFSTSKYDLAKLDDLFSHLTNYAINRENTDFGVPGACKWHLPQIKEAFASRGVDFALLFDRITTIVISTLLSICTEVPRNVSCFELFGFDVLFDENFKAWLLEVNFSPSLGVESDVDERVKYGLIKDMIETLNIQSFANRKTTTSSTSSKPPLPSSAVPTRGRKDSTTTSSSSPNPTLLAAQRRRTNSSSALSQQRKAVPTRATSASRNNNNNNKSVPQQFNSSSSVVFMDSECGQFRRVFPFNDVTERASVSLGSPATCSNHQERDKCIKTIVTELRRKDNTTQSALKGYANKWSNEA
eukprot:PhM_4_TR2261/c0_g1_i1/m.15705/K16600/TTLL2; tubulin polyglutamylase TTLL2